MTPFISQSISVSTNISSVSSDSPPASLVRPTQSSTVDRPASCTPDHQQNNTGTEKGGVREEGQSSVRRIRAPRGEGLSSLMASLTAPSCHNNFSSGVHKLPRLATNSSLNSEASCNSTSYRTLSTSSSCCQVSSGGIILKNIVLSFNLLSIVDSSLVTGGFPQRPPALAAL